MAKRSRSDTIQLKARMKEPLRAKLEAAAEEKGISLNAEMVHRLERSFSDEDSLANEFGGIDDYRVAKLLFAIIPLIEAQTGKSWRRDQATFRHVAEGWSAILHVIGHQSKKGPGGLFGLDLTDPNLGREAALSLMQERLADLARSPTPRDALVAALIGGFAMQPKRKTKPPAKKKRTS